jgi:hypothetical protein
MDVKRQNKLVFIFFILVSIFICIALFSYCSGGACSSATEETAVSSEEGASDYDESDTEQDDESKDSRIPSSDNDESASDNEQN